MPLQKVISIKQYKTIDKKFRQTNINKININVALVAISFPESRQVMIQLSSVIIRIYSGVSYIKASPSGVTRATANICSGARR